jgi:hypothetical protein
MEKVIENVVGVLHPLGLGRLLDVPSLPPNHWSLELILEVIDIISLWTLPTVIAGILNKGLDV